MLTLILPGYSPANKEWARKVKENLKLPGEVVVHEWQHWQEGQSFDLGYEVNRVLNTIGKNPVNFIAKSVGTRVVMELLPKLAKQVGKVILCGIPIDPLRYVKRIKLIDRNNLLVIQNSMDPVMPFKLVETYIHLIDKKIRAVEKEAKNHDYPYFNDFQKFLTI